ncbi:hypothetical protein [Flavobacterium sp. ACN6]|uniref:hypothetical protein n=1 Tax=Flavobacterium sp. ACN6 TaxID=1920426 RepID=UPI00352F28C9
MLRVIFLKNNFKIQYYEKVSLISSDCFRKFIGKCRYSASNFNLSISTYSR